MRWSTKEPVNTSDWHEWYAWHPVQINGTSDWVWFERVERREITNWSESIWIYREVKSSES